MVGAVAPFAGLVNLTTSPKPTNIWLPALQGAVAWAPISHLTLLTSGGTTYVGHLRPQATQYVRNRQADIGIGLHTAWGNGWYGAALGGVGWGRGVLAHPDQVSGGGFFATPAVITSSYDARYRRWFGQVYGGYTESAGLRFTGIIRYTQLRFESLTRHRLRSDGTNLPPELVPAAEAPTRYLEPACQLQVTRQRLGAVFAVGLSVALQHPTMPPTGQIAPYQRVTPMMSVGGALRLGR